MPPLTRQPTRQSYLSWWSDSNSLLISNPIHMAAKPLAKLMYHRDVSNFIKRQRGIPLSEETMEVFLSYLRWKYVADQTKIIILRDLNERAQMESEARAAVKALAIYDILIESSNDVKRWFCFVLGCLAFHKSTVGDVLAVEPCASLVTLLRDPDISVVRRTISALSHFASDPKGAQAVVDANVLNFVHELLKSPHSGVRRDACSMLGSLALHKSTVGAVLAVQPCASLGTLLRDPDISVIRRTIYALTEFAFDPKRAQAVVRANVLDLLLKSPHSGVRKYAYWTLSRPAFHKSTVGAVLPVQPCASLVTLLRDPDISVVRRTIYALTEFAFHPKRAQAVVHANVLDLLLKSPNSGVRRDACWMLGSLALYKSTVGAVLAVEPCASLVTLLRDPDILVVEGAIYALSRFTFDLNGAQAVVDANVLYFIHELLKSPNSGVRIFACWTLGYLVWHKSTVAAVLVVELCMHLIELLRDTDIHVVEAAIYALSQFASDRNGAQAVADANALDLIHELLESPNSGVRRYACWMLGYLGSHTSTLGTVLAIEPCVRLVPLLRDPDILVVDGAIYALSRFASDPNGAQAVVDANALDLIHELLKSPNNGVGRYVCWTLGQLALHESTVGAVLAVQPCASLVTLLRDPDILVVRRAIYALSEFASDRNGAQAVVDTNVLHFVHELLKSPNSGVRRYACWTLGRLALHESTVSAVLALQPCASLVTLLRDANILVVRRAIYALSEFASDRNGAQAVVDTNVFDFVHELLKSPNSGVRRYTCWMLGNLGSHMSTLGTVLAIEPCVRPVSLLRETDSLVVEGTIYALSQFPLNLRGAKAVMDANVLDIAHELFKSSNSQVRANTCRMIGWLAKHDSTAGLMLRMKPCAQLVDLSKDSHDSVVEAAVFALCEITRNKPEGVDAVLGAGVLDLVQDLLASPNFEIRRDVCVMIGRLVHYTRVPRAT